MNEAPSSKQSPALPLVLAVLGLVALVGAILLVLQLRSGVSELHSEYARAISNQPAATAEPVKSADPAEPAAATAPAKDAAPADGAEEAAPEETAEAAADAEPSEPVGAEAPKEPEVTQPDAVEPEVPATPEPTDASIGEGKWRFTVQHRPFSVSIAGENAIEDVAQMLLEDSESTALVTGYNNPKFSSKAAKSLARKVRGLIAQKGVEQYRVKTETNQLDDIETFSIQIDFKTKGK